MESRRDPLSPEISRLENHDGIAIPRLFLDKTLIAYDRQNSMVIKQYSYNLSKLELHVHL